MKQINLKYIGEEMIRMIEKAIKIIQDESHDVRVEKKAAYDVTKEDFATNGDKKAQKMFIEEIQKHFPDFGIIAEEKELTIPCKNPDHDIYFTVDPLDGTKAYERSQSHGVGTMLALICDEKIIAAYIGDINTGEIYGYMQEDLDDKKPTDVFRTRFGVKSILKPEIEMLLNKQYCLLREAPYLQPKIIQEMSKKAEDGGLFKNLEVGGGSIGTCLARLWKGEIGAVVIDPSFTTPWDLAPVLGICQKLGFIFLKIGEDGVTVKQHFPTPIKKVVEKNFSEIIVHENFVPEIGRWITKNIKQN